MNVSNEPETVEQSVVRNLSYLTKTERKHLKTKERIAELINSRIQKGWAFLGTSREVYEQRKALIIAEVVKQLS